MLAFAITMILENFINIAARRIYSSKCDYFVDSHIFAQKKTLGIREPWYQFDPVLKGPQFDPVFI
jgi:hypothetical protein